MANLPNRIHITGASGSGTTSLGALIADRYRHRHVDTDDFFWLPSDPPYTRKRPEDERLTLLRKQLAAVGHWVLSGSVVGWGDSLISRFDLVVYLSVPTEVRLARLREREVERYGEVAVAPGGHRHEAVEAFLDWAGRYDDGGLDIRSRALHEEWLKKITCPVIRLEGDVPAAEHLAKLTDKYANAV